MTLALLEGGSVFLATIVTARLSALPVLHEWTPVSGVYAQASLLALCVMAAGYLVELYDLRTVPSFTRYAARLVRAGGLLLVPVGGLLAVAPEWGFVEGATALSILVAMVGVSLVAIRAIFYILLRIAPFDKRTLIVGEGPLTHELVREIQARPGCGYRIVGIVGEGGASRPERSRDLLLGPLDEAQRIIDELRPERIIVALAQPRGRLPVHHLVGARLLRGIVVEEGGDVYERLTEKLAIESLTPSSVIYSKDFQPSGFPRAIARTISLLAATVGLLGFAPLLLLIALAIKLDSPGPVLFLQDRIGMGGGRFRLLKFRTMHPADEHLSEWVRDNGHRITRVGRWLRKYRLDELPQFVNVLRGDMNLVGPRPHPASNFELLTLVSRNTPECGVPIPCYSLRSMVRPGITGWAQVRYRYANDLDEEIEKMRYDLYYVKHLSVALDLRILLETVRIVLRGRGSEGDEDSATRAPGQDIASRPRTESSVRDRQPQSVYRNESHASATAADRGLGAAGPDTGLAIREMRRVDAIEGFGDGRPR